jgi:hypothetical protein
VAGQVRLYNHTFGHPIGWVFSLGRVWQYLSVHWVGFYLSVNGTSISRRKKLGRIPFKRKLRSSCI